MEKDLTTMTWRIESVEEIKAIIKEEIEYKGLSVIIPRRECIQTFKRHAKEKKNA